MANGFVHDKNNMNSSYLKIFNSIFTGKNVAVFSTDKTALLEKKSG